MDCGIVEQLVPGVLRTSAGIHYFSPVTILRVLHQHGIAEDTAASIVGQLVESAIVAENRPEGRGA